MINLSLQQFMVDGKQTTYADYLDEAIKNFDPVIKDAITKKLLNLTQICQLFPVYIANDIMADYIVQNMKLEFRSGWEFYNYEDDNSVFHQKELCFLDEGGIIKKQWTDSMYRRILDKLYQTRTYEDKAPTDIISPTTSITKKFEFEYSHFLPTHNKKCKFLHGHRGQLEVTVAGKVDIDGFVTDFSKLKAIVNNKIISKFDHNFLNDVCPIPTCENILLWIWAKLVNDIEGLSKLRLYEQSDSFAELTKDDVAEFITCSLCPDGKSIYNMFK